MYREYNPRRVSVSWGDIQFVGFMDGTFVTAERSEDAVTKKVGAHGDVTACLNADLSGTVGVTLKQTSPTNDQLSANQADPKNKRLPVKPLLVKDINGNTIVHAEIAWIKKVPKTDFAEEEMGREWTFECAELEFSVGGTNG